MKESNIGLAETPRKTCKNSLLCVARTANPNITFPCLRSIEKFSGRSGVTAVKDPNISTMWLSDRRYTGLIVGYHVRCTENGTLTEILRSFRRHTHSLCADTDLPSGTRGEHWRHFADSDHAESIRRRVMPILLYCRENE